MHSLWCCKVPFLSLACPKDLLNCSNTDANCRALPIVRESPGSIETPSVQLDDCELGPTEIELRLDPPGPVLGYEYWDNDGVDEAARLDRSFFQWRNVASSGP